MLSNAGLRRVSVTALCSVDEANEIVRCRLDSPGSRERLIPVRYLVQSGIMSRHKAFRLCRRECHTRMTASALHEPPRAVLMPCSVSRTPILALLVASRKAFRGGPKRQ
jgi:hypothetical protein